MVEAKGALDVSCPACGAAVGELCLVDGKRVQPHSVREDIALGLPTIYSA